MKKIIETIKRKDLDIISLIIFMVTILAFYRMLRPYDELWLFSYIYKMNIGYEIYNDLNVIVTPLFFWIGNLFFKILGANFLTYTIYTIVTYVCIFILIFNIFKTLKIKRRRSIIYTIIIFYILSGFVSTGNNYNIFVFLPILITILVLLKGNKNNYLLGAMSFIVFITKQNIGLYFVLGIILYKLIKNNSYKQKIKDILKIVITFAILLLSFLFIFYKENLLNNFISYCFLGIGEFGIKNMMLPLSNAIIMIFFIFVLLFNIYVLNNKKINLDDKIKENLYVLICVGAPLLLMAYPIFNIAHVLKGGLVLMIGLLYLLDTMLISELITNRKVEKNIYKFIIIMAIIILLVHLYIIIEVAKNNHTTFDKNSPFYGILCKENVCREINNMCNYIKQQNIKGVEVKILSHKANLYMVPLKQNNINIDLPNLGNFGKEGEDGVIKQISNMKNTQILIQTAEENLFWQESKKIRKYIQDNYKKVGIIEDFDIYYIP